MQTVRIGAAIAFDVVSTLNGNDERLPELELRRQKQYTHIYNKTQSTTTTKQQSTTQPKATTFAQKSSKSAASCKGFCCFVCGWFFV
jgi:hypothetical protein